MSLDQHNTGINAISSVSTAHNGSVNGLAFTSDGHYIVSTGHDEAMRLWNSSSGVNMLVSVVKLY